MTKTFVFTNLRLFRLYWSLYWLTRIGLYTGIKIFIQMLRVKVKRCNERLLYDRGDTEVFDEKGKILNMLNCGIKTEKGRNTFGLLNNFFLDWISLTQRGSLLLDWVGSISPFQLGLLYCFWVFFGIHAESIRFSKSINRRFLQKSTRIFFKLVTKLIQISV